MKGKKARGGVREFFTVVVIAVVIAGVMTLLTVVPPVSVLYSWLMEHNWQFVWTGLVAGVIGMALGFYRIKAEEKETSDAGSNK